MSKVPELRAQVLRLCQAECWSIGIIEKKLHVLHDFVRRDCRSFGGIKISSLDLTAIKNFSK
jgi:hypothetical protein